MHAWCHELCGLLTMCSNQLKARGAEGIPLKTKAGKNNLMRLKKLTCLYQSRDFIECFLDCFEKE